MRLIGVGVGPGDPDLVTLRAARVLTVAGLVFVPGRDGAGAGRAETVVRAVIDHDRVQRLEFALGEGRDDGRREAGRDLAAERIVAWLRAGRGTAAFATIGDPSLYATFGYLAAALRHKEPAIEIELVPGITAMQALAAATGQPLAEGSDPLTLLPMADGEMSHLTAALVTGAPLVVYKGGRHLPAIARAIHEAGRQAVVGTEIGLATQEVRPLLPVEQPQRYLATILIAAAPDRDGGAP